jgi:hypothetical protein
MVNNSINIKKTKKYPTSNNWTQKRPWFKSILSESLFINLKNIDKIDLLELITDIRNNWKGETSHIINMTAVFGY